MHHVIWIFVLQRLSKSDVIKRLLKRGVLNIKNALMLNLGDEEKKLGRRMRRGKKFTDNDAWS